MTLVAVIQMKKGWDSTKGLEKGLAEMATDIHAKASILAPKETRALVNSGKITRIDAEAYKVSFGSSKVPYARRRHFENKKTPSSLGYLSKAADAVARSDKDKYFRHKVVDV